MDARDVIAEANKWRYKQAWDGGGREYALRDADVVLAALAADGYVILRKEEIREGSEASSD